MKKPVCWDWEPSSSRHWELMWKPFPENRVFPKSCHRGRLQKCWLGRVPDIGMRTREISEDFFFLSFFFFFFKFLGIVVLFAEFCKVTLYWALFVWMGEVPSLRWTSQNPSELAIITTSVLQMRKRGTSDLSTTTQLVMGDFLGFALNTLSPSFFFSLKILKKNVDQHLFVH